MAVSRVPEFVARAELFADLPAEAISLLSEQGRLRHFALGWTLIRQGDPCNSMYLLLDGPVRVERSHPALAQPLLLAELGPGDVVGVMGILEGAPRGETATAIKECEALELDRSVVTEVILCFPEFSAALLRTIGGRIRTAEELTAKVLSEVDQQHG